MNTILPSVDLQSKRTLQSSSLLSEKKEKTNKQETSKESEMRSELPDRVVLSELYSLREDISWQEGISIDGDGRYSLSRQFQARAQSRTEIAVEESRQETEITSLSDLENVLSEENLNRAIQQIERLADLNQSMEQTISSGDVSSLDGGNFAADFSMHLSPQIQQYLTIIRQLSKDERTLENFLDQVDAFLNRAETGDGSFSGVISGFTQSIDFMAQEVVSQKIAEQYGAEEGTKAMESIRAEISEEVQVQASDPLVLDLDGDGIELTNVDDGVWFAIDANGEKRQTAFVTGGDAFLALDRNGNGQIDDGKELFGDQNGAKDGLEELRKYDDNQDNVIDSKDSIFTSLRLFADSNMDGLSQAHELKSLKEMGIAAISLDGQDVNQTISGGNLLTKISSFLRADGTSGLAGDVNLNFIS